MEWIKFFVYSWVQFIGHIAWPVAIISILIIFRRAIRDKLRGLTEFEGLGVGAKFATQEIEELVKKLKFVDIKESNLTWDKYMDALEQWAFWIVVHLMELSDKYMYGFQPEKTFKALQKTTKQFNMVRNKIKKERPDSEFLDPLNSIFDKVVECLQRYEKLEPKPERTRRSRLEDFLD